MKQKADFEKLKELVKDIHIAMLSSIKDNQVHSRPMATSEVDADGTIWFFTKDDSAKVTEIEQNASVTLSYANPQSNTYVAVIGKTAVSHDKEKIKELWNPMLKAWFPNGPEDPEIGLLKFTPETAEYWDSKAGRMVALFNIAKAALNGQTYDQGEHGKLNLN